MKKHLLLKVDRSCDGTTMCGKIVSELSDGDWPYVNDLIVNTTTFYLHFELPEGKISPIILDQINKLL